MLGVASGSAAQKGDARPTLMLLGGSRHQVPAIEAAKRLGYRTVLCDYLPDNPGQYVADTFYRESTVDRELMLRIARHERIDGVISFGSDVAAPTAAYISEQMGLATNPLTSVEILSDKRLFRPYLAEHGFNCPRVAFLSKDASAGELASVTKDFVYPVVLKPTDSSGSRGVTVLEAPDTDKIADALAYASEFSRNGTLVAEEYISYGFPYLIGGDIFVAEGRVRFWGLMSCLRDEGLAALVPVGKAFPTGLDAVREASVRAEIERLVSSLGLQFGEMNVEVIVDRAGRSFIVELGGRAGGNMIPLQLQDISGIDLVDASVRYAMGERDLMVDFEGNGASIATSVLHASETGVFRGVSYAPEVQKHIYREMVYVESGDHVERFDYGSKALGLVFLRFETPDEMWDVLGRMHELVAVNVDEDASAPQP